MRYQIFFLIPFALACTKPKPTIIGKWQSTESTCQEFWAGNPVKAGSSVIEFTADKMILKTSEKNNCEQIIEYRVEHISPSRLVASAPQMTQKCVELKLDVQSSMTFEYSFKDKAVVLESKSGIPRCNVLSRI